MAIKIPSLQFRVDCYHGVESPGYDVAMKQTYIKVDSRFISTTVKFLLHQSPEVYKGYAHMHVLITVSVLYSNNPKICS